MWRSLTRISILLVPILGASAAPLEAAASISLFGLFAQLQPAMEAVPGEPPKEQPAESPLPPARRDERAEFNRICGQVQAVPGLSNEQIQTLIEDSETLTRILKRSENPQAKILLKRLEMCREFFKYSLEARRQLPHPNPVE
jgi:hypothetical protein